MAPLPPSVAFPGWPGPTGQPAPVVQIAMLAPVAEYVQEHLRSRGMFLDGPFETDADDIPTYTVGIGDELWESARAQTKIDLVLDENCRPGREE